MTIDAPIRKPAALMEGMPPGLYVGVVGFTEGGCVQMAAATRPWEPKREFHPSPAARAEFYAIAKAAYPENPPGYVNVWVEVFEE